MANCLIVKRWATSKFPLMNVMIIMKIFVFKYTGYSREGISEEKWNLDLVLICMMGK